MNKLLHIIAVLGIFVSLFPFVVLCEGIGFDEYIWWHYLTLYAVYAMFFLWGRLCSLWAAAANHSRAFRPKALFLSRAAVILPTLLFLLVCGWLELSSGLFIYALPAALIAFKGGHSTARRDYTDVFGRGWFALFFVTAVVASILLWFSHDEKIMSSGNFQLCAAFGMLIVVSAILTNQTNIDTCTHQRDANRVALPRGVRAYNLKLCSLIAVITVGLFLFTPPLARFVANLLKGLMAIALSLIQASNYQPAVDDMISDADGNGMGINSADNTIMDLIYVIAASVLVYVIVRYRRQIADFFRDTFAFLFKDNSTYSDVAYSDEFSDIQDVSHSSYLSRKLENHLYKSFSRESDSSRKYRIGYRLMLLRLADTPFAAVASDNTDVHRKKGENGLRNEKVSNIVDVYNKVRYNSYTPTVEEINFAETFIDEIRRKI